MSVPLASNCTTSCMSLTLSIAFAGHQAAQGQQARSEPRDGFSQFIG